MPVPPLRITSKTAEEVRADVVARIPQITPHWTNFNDAELGMVLLTVIAAMLEVNRFEADMIASELTVEHVRQRPYGLRLFRWIGYQHHRKGGSRVTLTFTLGAPAVKPVTIQPYTNQLVTEARVRGTQGISFVSTETAVIGVGQSVIEVPAIQGKRESQSFSSNDTANQHFLLSSARIAQGTIVVYINNQVWTQVEHFVDSDRDSHHVRVYTDEYDFVHMLFGDGLSGAIPSGSITAVYVDTEGEAGGNVGPGRITELASPVFDSDGAPVSPQPRVTNHEAADGGEDEETLYQAKKTAPRVYSAQRRAVTTPDFLGWVEHFPGIQQAAVVQIQDFAPDSTDIDYYQVKIPIIPTDGGLPSAALKRALETELKRLKVVPDDVEVIDPKYVPVDVEAEFYTEKNHVKTVSQIKAEVEAVIIEFFAPAEAPSGLSLIGREPDGLVFGQDVSWSRLLTAIQNVDGVASVRDITPNMDVAIAPDEIAILGAGSPVLTLLGEV